MTTIKMNSYKGKKLLALANNNEGYRLCDVYSSWSSAKQRAYDWCREQCYGYDGRRFHIVSHNTFGFSVAWETPEGIRIETKDSSYLLVPED